MELLTAPRNLRQAALASALTTTASLPRLLLWSGSPYPIWFTATVVALTSAVMWAFVLAWEERKLGRAPFALPSDQRLWLAATGFALAAVMFRSLVLDPALYSRGLAERPQTTSQWLAGGLFQLAYLQLFLLFAPVAVCSRLVRDRSVAFVLVVALGLYVSWRTLQRSGADVTGALALEVLLARAIGDAAAVWFYQRGGVFIVWWIAALVHLRHLGVLLR